MYPATNMRKPINRPKPAITKTHTRIATMVETPTKLSELINKINMLYRASSQSEAAKIDMEIAEILGIQKCSKQGSNQPCYTYSMSEPAIVIVVSKNLVFTISSEYIAISIL